MKKILALLLVFCMLFSVAALIAGCEDSGRKKNNSSNYQGSTKIVDKLSVSHCYIPPSISYNTIIIDG